MVLLYFATTYLAFSNIVSIENKGDDLQVNFTGEAPKIDVTKIRFETHFIDFPLESPSLAALPMKEGFNGPFSKAQVVASEGGGGFLRIYTRKRMTKNALDIVSRDGAWILGERAMFQAKDYLDIVSVVVAGLLLAIFGLRFRKRRKVETSTPPLELLGSQFLGKNLSVHFIKAGGRDFLLASGPTGLSLLPISQTEVREVRPQERELRSAPPQLQSAPPETKATSELNDVTRMIREKLKKLPPL